MSGYVICAAVTVLLSWGICTLRTKKAFLTLKLYLLLLPLGFVMAKLMYLLLLLPGLIQRGTLFTDAISLNAEKFSFAGGELGVLLGLLWFSRRTHQKKLPHAFAPAGALLAAGFRLAEYYLGPAFLHHGMIGLGVEVEEDAALCFFPFAIQDEWGIWCQAVFAWEAMLALLICLLSLCFSRRKHVFEWTLFVLLATQMLTEMFHCQKLSWGFVSAEQICCAVILCVMILLSESRRRLPRMLHTALWIVAALLLISAAELQLDKSYLSSLLWGIDSPVAVWVSEHEQLFGYLLLTGGLAMLCMLEARLLKQENKA